MKKLFVITLALAMILAMATTAFAALPAEDSKDVTITYLPTDDETPVYGAEIAWTDLSITYAYGEGWDPEELDYIDAATGNWNDATVKVTITNNSNAKIYSNVTYTAENGLTGTVAGAGEIAAATVGNAATQEVTITISGKPADYAVTDGGSITVALSSTAPAAQ